MMLRANKLIALAGLAWALSLAGCRARMVRFQLVNTSAEPLSTIIVDYPTATFGKDKLAPGEAFSSSVKLTDTGAIKVQFVDANGAGHNYVGPVLHKDDLGSVEIRLNQTGAAAYPNVVSR